MGLFHVEGKINATGGMLYINCPSSGEDCPINCPSSGEDCPSSDRHLPPPPPPLRLNFGLKLHYLQTFTGKFYIILAGDNR